jgi:type IV pilus assembly protein PilY1
VISGTTKDGMYLEVRDKDTASAYYAYNTPPNRDPGYCSGNISAQQRTECSNMGLTATRSFTPGNATDAGSFLKGPLWYAAKYGVPDRDPSKIAGDPDNYFLVTNAGTLKDQLTKAFNDILQNISSVTAVSVDMPTATLSEGADLYRTSFEVEYWSGDVIREKVTTTSRTPVWSAAELLSARSTDDRKIYYPSRTGGAVALSPFTYSSLSGQQSDAAWLTVLNTDPATNAADGQAKKRIEFLRGEVRDDLRVRKPLASGKPNVLGDIVKSSLVRVKGGLYRASAADKLEGSTTYAAFAAGQSAKEMLYVGANDGMLHAFDAASGKEEFAFIPSGVKDSLNVLTTRYGAGGAPHRYFVDGTPVVSDVYFGNAWHRVLVGSLGAGGRQVFAMDVTDPTAPRLLWEFGVAQDERMGYSLPTPVVARLNDSGQTKGKWVVFLSNGYQGLNSASGESSLFVLDVSSGDVIRRFDFAGGMTTAELNALPAPKNGLSRATVVDNNGDGKVDMAYAGDLAGNVWRVDLTSGASGSWNGQLFFVARDAGRGNGAGNRLPITTAPYVVRHPSGKGDVVSFGTGRFMTDDDRQDTRRQSVFGVWDRYSTPPATAPQPLPTAGKGRGDLQAQQFTEVAGFPGKFALSANPVTWYKDATSTSDSNVQNWGWFVDLPRDGERLVYDMSLYGRGLVFTSIRPLSDPCSAGMTSTIYAIDPNTGGKTDYVAFDVNKDGIFNASDNLAGQQVNGYEVGPGKPTISGAKIFDSSGKQGGAGGAGTGGGDDINSGMDRGRQNWRRQPPNP